METHNLFVLNGLGNGQFASAQLSGKPVWQVTCQRVSKSFDRVVVLCAPDASYDLEGVQFLPVEKGDVYTVFSQLLEKFSEYDNYIFADLFAPFLEAELGLSFAKVTDEQIAHFTYGEHYPRGVAPQVVSKEGLEVLRNVASGNNAPFTDETILDLMGIDINSYDIEIEVSPIDFRRYRLDLRARSFHSVALLNKLASVLGEQFVDLAYEQLSRFILDNLSLLRVLPGYIEIDLSGNCNLACSFCPREALSLSGRDDLPYIETEKAFMLAEQITALNPECVVAFSPYSEPMLHPDFKKIVSAFLERGLKVLIETNGTKIDQSMADFFASVPVEQLIVIVSLDAVKSGEYERLKGTDMFQLVVDNARYLLSVKKRNVFLQIVNTEELSPVVAGFYDFWKAEEDKVLPRKYNNFAERLPGKPAADFSPIRRGPCWHLARDMIVRVDGSVPLCKQDINVQNFCANVFDEGIEQVWYSLGECYAAHLADSNTHFDICSCCDEWFTYNY